MNLTVSYDDFRSRVLAWVYSQQTAETQFRMNEGSDSTIYTSCFALFIFDLFGEVESWSQNEKNLWANYITSFQDENSGYFMPEEYSGGIDTKPVQQLTCFCLSALSILGSSPNYELAFLKKWSRPEDVYGWLNNIGCFNGLPGTGNMAMFLGIFLTRQYEMNKAKSVLDCLNSWFYWHDRTQNESTGFWGNSLRNRYYGGFQNALHQFIIYKYWDRLIPCHTKIVDRVLLLQDEDGHFAAIPGGGGCWDYDAADILIHCGYVTGYRKRDVGAALTRLCFAILKNQNDDGGFCESRKRPYSICNALGPSSLRFVFAGHDPFLWYYRLRAVASASRSGREQVRTHWTRKGRLWDQSDLWDTWFRCLTIAEIEKALNPLHRKSKWKFQRFIGLGCYTSHD